MTHRGTHTRFKAMKMFGGSFLSLFLLLEMVLSEETTTISAATTLGKLYRQARSEQYGYASRYGSDSSVTSGAIGIRPEPVEHRDAAYFESRCITCDQRKPAATNRGWRQRPRMGYYEDDLEERRYRDRYDDRYERGGALAPEYEYEKPRGPGYEYDRPRGPALEYDRTRGSPYDYDRPRTPPYEYDRPDPYSRNELIRPIPMMPYGDRYDSRYDRDRNYYDPLYDPRYDPKYDRNYERGNGYDNLDLRYQFYGGRYDRHSAPRKPIDPYDPVDPYADRYDRYTRNNYWMRYDPYDRYEKYDPYDRNQWRRPYEDRYPSRGGPPDSRGYQASGSWGPGYDRGYASAWNYSGTRDSWRDYNRDPGNGDNWRDLNRDRDSGAYRPRDYFYDSTAAPGAGSRVTSYLHDRPESSTKADSTDRDKPTSSPQSQDNKVYQD
ncbi:eukaryotic translation initiation factor 3 subunit A [Venturia canescens]|uniref:eukaryotic translation initiation factor 3 subunit A n=1 Tax=Venturia canescens TaxID=32260 RepID=UPI001C9CF44A|nr:eukaryotic translation initiation factor 3 subunit A [Venturia canescens]